MTQAKTKTYQPEDIETLKQFMAQMTTDELVAFMTEILSMPDEEKKRGHIFKTRKRRRG